MPWLGLGDLIILILIINLFLITDIIMLKMLIPNRSIEICFLGFKLKLGEPINDQVQRGSRRVS